jgi:hypothetical protein
VKRAFHMSFYVPKSPEKTQQVQRGTLFSVVEAASCRLEKTIPPLYKETINSL